ncbi:MAG: HAMP domain-containing histidine kinase [Bacteroides sp.]|nr:HAMP domain-containing histidine kinase [Bacteroides sp.]MCM1550981.1 HAMP domain-containing histidine kinase [Clostridium sp.]
MIIACGQVFQRSYHERSLQNKILQVQSQCNILASQVLLNDFMISSSTDNLNTEIDQLANVLEGRIIIVDSEYKIIKDTYTIEQDKYMMSTDVHNLMLGKIPNKYNIMNQNQYVEILVPILDSSVVTTVIDNGNASGHSSNPASAETRQVKGVIICMVSIRDLLETDAYMQAQGRIWYALFLFVALLISWLMAFWIPRPIRKLNNKLKQVSEGHLDEMIEMEGSTEIMDLTDTFNQILSKLQLLENSRQEFVSNVSHELKTPITSMKVLADSLLVQEDTPAEMYREFMTDIAEEIERENKIINDLLTLVRLDKQAVDLNVEAVSINELLELLLKRIRPIAAKRNIEIIFESMRDVVAEIDVVKMSLAFTNLIENAVKYNKDDGWVHVVLDADHKFFYVKISDSGVGIPEDCQERVFERFYRVDKARSRETGGTGLGLAITRNAILMHKGAINIYSVPEEGTTFTVRVPLTYIS